MSFPSIPFALPPHADEDSAYQKLVKPDFGGDGETFADWIVPSGECWLVQTITASWSVVSAGNDHHVLCDYDDNDGNLVVRLATTTSITQGIAAYFSGGLGYSTTVGAGQLGDSPIVQMVALPYIVMLPASDIGIQITKAQSGSDVFQGANAVNMTVTAWSFGKGSTVATEKPVVTPKIA